MYSFVDISQYLMYYEHNTLKDSYYTRKVFKQLIMCC